MGSGPRKGFEFVKYLNMALELSKSSLEFSKNNAKIKNRIIELYNQGMDLPEIIRKTKTEFSKFRDYNIFQKNNVEIIIRRYLRLNARTQFVLREKLRLQRKREKEVTSLDKVKKKFTKRKPETVESVLKLAGQGYTPGQIAKKLGMTRNTAIGIIRDRKSTKE